MKLDVTNEFKLDSREVLTVSGLKNCLVEFVYDNGEMPESIVMGKDQYRQLCYITEGMLPTSFLGIPLDFMRNEKECGDPLEVMSASTLYEPKPIKIDPIVEIDPVIEPIKEEPIVEPIEDIKPVEPGELSGELPKEVIDL
jgi:hypothetical protein